MDFYEQIRASIAEETGDRDKYAKLAEIAPTDKTKKILLDMSREEWRHREFLQEILSDGKQDHAAQVVQPTTSHIPQHVPPQSAGGAKPDANHKIISAAIIPTAEVK